MAEIIQLKISLADTKPSIWRRVLVKSSTSLLELHLIFQETMGWEGYHLFEFSKGKQRFGMPDKEFDDADLIDAGKIHLSAIIAKEKDKFRYTYDFGDSWEHSIVAENFCRKKRTGNIRSASTAR